MKTCKRCGNTTRFKPDGECIDCANVRRKARRATRRGILTREEEREPKVTPKDPRILTIDIETAPLLSYHWGLWEQNIGLDFIKDEWTILSFSAKWLNSREILFSSTYNENVDKIRDDKQLTGEICDLLHLADIVIGQNVARFDIKKINSRAIVHGFLPYSPVRVIDTLAVAKNVFAHTSNKLEWQSRYLAASQKLKHRRFPGFELWSECLRGNKLAWKDMRKYNIRDVVATEQLYLKQRPWIRNHPNLNPFGTLAGERCPKCTSGKLLQHGQAVLTVGVYPRYQCLSCGGWSRGKQLQNSLEARKSQLVSI